MYNVKHTESLQACFICLLSNSLLLCLFFLCSSVNPSPSETEWRSVGRTACASSALAHSSSPMNRSRSTGQAVSPASASLCPLRLGPQGASSLMPHVFEAHLASLANQVSVRSVVRPVMLICQPRIKQHKQTNQSFIIVIIVEYYQYIFLYKHILYIFHTCYIVYILCVIRWRVHSPLLFSIKQEDDNLIPQHQQ